MRANADKDQKHQNTTAANETSQSTGNSEATFEFVDNRVEAVQFRKLQAIADNRSEAGRSPKRITQRNVAKTIHQKPYIVAQKIELRRLFRGEAGQLTRGPQNKPLHTNDATVATDIGVSYDASPGQTGIVQRTPIPDEEKYKEYRGLDPEIDNHWIKLKKMIYADNNLVLLENLNAFFEPLGVLLRDKQFRRRVNDRISNLEREIASNKRLEEEKEARQQQREQKIEEETQEKARAQAALLELREIRNGQIAEQQKLQEDQSSDDEQYMDSRKVLKPFSDKRQHQTEHSPKIYVLPEVNVREKWFKDLVVCTIFDGPAFRNYMSALRELERIVKRSEVVKGILCEAVTGKNPLKRVRVFNVKEFKAASDESQKAAGEYLEEDDTLYLAVQLGGAFTDTLFDIASTTFHELTHRFLVKNINRRSAPYDPSNIPNEFQGSSSDRKSDILREWESFKGNLNMYGIIVNSLEQLVPNALYEERAKTASRITKLVSHLLVAYKEFQFDMEVYSHFMEIYLAIARLPFEEDVDTCVSEVLQRCFPLTLKYFQLQLYPLISSSKK